MLPQSHNDESFEINPDPSNPECVLLTGRDFWKPIRAQNDFLMMLIKEGLHFLTALLDTWSENLEEYLIVTVSGETNIFFLLVFSVKL